MAQDTSGNARNQADVPLGFYFWSTPTSELSQDTVVLGQDAVDDPQGHNDGTAAMGFAPCIDAHGQPCLETCTTNSVAVTPAFLRGLAYSLGKDLSWSFWIEARRFCHAH